MAALIDLAWRLVEPDDLAAVTALEAASYPADEAATPEKLAYRVAHARELFLVATAAGDASGSRILVGFICGTAARSAVLTHDSMSTHEAGGGSLCIHSVVVDAAYRKRGLATWLLARYIDHIAANVPAIERMLLLAHSDKVGLYARAGFVAQGVSAVVHGSEPWTEMSRPVSREDTQARVYQVDAFAFDEGRLAALSEGAGGVSAAAAGGASSTASSAAATATGGGRTVRCGNPAAVVMLPLPCEGSTAWPADAWLGSMASQLNLPMTAYLRNRPDGRWDVRYFTPAGGEVPFCGHATIAASYALFHEGHVPTGSLATRATFVTVKGAEVNISRLGEDGTAAAPSGATAAVEPADASWMSGGFQMSVVVDVPKALPVDAVASALPTLADGLGLPLDRLAPAAAAADGSARRGVLWVGKNSLDMLVVVSRDVFNDMVPNTAATATLDARIVTITTAGDRLALPAADATAAALLKPVTGFKHATADGSPAPYPTHAFHTVSRCLAPNNGLPEDPVCGAAHVGVCAYWSDALLATGSGAAAAPAAEAGPWLTAFQSSPRGGILQLRYDRPAGRVLLRGNAASFMRGRLTAPIPR